MSVLVRTSNKHKQNRQAEALNEKKTCNGGTHNKKVGKRFNSKKTKIWSLLLILRRS